MPDGTQRQSSLDKAVHEALTLGRQGLADDDPAREEMRLNRRVNAKTAANNMTSGDISFTTMRPKDPMFYWRQNNLPFELDKPDQLKQLRDLCRMVYLTNPVIAACVDIYSKYPVVGAELRCKDPSIEGFYTDLFFDQLEYEDFFVDVGKEYWTVGEAWPFGSFNELLGVWEDDELLNPDDIDVIVTPFQREPRFEMRLPQSLRDIIENRKPEWEYEALMRSYPELKNFVGGNMDEKRMPVSNILLRQLRFKADTFNPRGVPILMRAIRYIVQEEMLNAAQEAVASRLYLPLILAKLGASAQELGTETPWVPTAGDLDEFESRLDAAFAGDFRVLVHHFAVNMQSVFGREVMPRLDGDFERIMEKELQVFGLSKTLLNGAQGGETYAADALNRDLVSQLLTTYQRLLRKLWKDRAMVVAEAQEHYDYEIRGGKRYPIMEEVLEMDEEGNYRIVEQPKLLIPDIHFKSMNMRSETEERQFTEALRQSGVPISNQTRLTNVPIELDDELDRVKEEQIQAAVKAQETRKETYLALRDQGLPIPEDLRNDFEPKAQTAGGGNPAAEGPGEPAPQEALPNIGTDDATDNSALVPPQEEEGPGGEDIPAGIPMDGRQEDGTKRLPRNHWGEGASRPKESDEMRAHMPRAAILTDSEGNELEEPGGLQVGPKHVGIRRHAALDPDKPLDDQVHQPA